MTPGQGPEREDPDSLRPLSGGRHSIDPEIVAHNQRERLIAALAAVVAERGYRETAVAQIAERASVSLRTFYEQFDSKEDCFLAAYEALDSYIGTLVDNALETQKEWPERVAAAFEALIEFLSHRPGFARVYLVESYVVGDDLAAARERTTQRFIALLKPGRKERAGDVGLADGIEEGLVGGIFTLLARRVLGGDELGLLVPSVIEFALAPYIGTEAAREVAARRG